MIYKHELKPVWQNEPDQKLYLSLKY